VVWWQDSLEDSDNLMEKVVGLSALDPVDDELIGGDVEINLPSGMWSSIQQFDGLLCADAFVY
jgi:hypothetical protein